MVAASGDTNADDEHDPEGATIAFERSQVSALVVHVQRHLAEIEAAISAAGRRHLRSLRAVRTADRQSSARGEAGGTHMYPMRIRRQLTLLPHFAFTRRRLTCCVPAISRTVRVRWTDHNHRRE